MTVPAVPATDGPLPPVEIRRTATLALAGLLALTGVVTAFGFAAQLRANTVTDLLSDAGYTPVPPATVTSDGLLCAYGGCARVSVTYGPPVATTPASASTTAGGSTLTVYGGASPRWADLGDDHSVRLDPVDADTDFTAILTMILESEG